MLAEQRGKDLFIVDNGISGWDGIRYLSEWCDISKSFDIATLRAVRLDESGWQWIAALLKPDGAFLHIGDRGEATEPSLHKIGTWSLQALGPVSLYGG